MRNIIIALFAPVIAGCTTPIDNDTNPLTEFANALSAPLKTIATTDLLDAAYNFDQAQMLGIIPADSKLPACQHKINQALGIEPSTSKPTVKAFTPKNGGLVSAGSIAYIDALKFAELKQNGIGIPQDCVTAYGTIQLQGLDQLVTGGFQIVVTPAGATPAALP